MSSAGRSVLENCLYLNWAVPPSMLPEPPAPLRYDVRNWGGGEAVFVSALLFRHRRLRFRLLPFARVSHPQFQLQACTIDDDGTPSVLIQSILLPGWVAPGARWIADQPARTAEFSYPLAGSVATGLSRWEVSRRARLLVEAEPGSSALGAGPVLGSWDRTVAYLCRRPVAYAIGARGLHSIRFESEPVDVVPMKATVLEDGLLNRCLSSGGEPSWPALHTAWLCPRMIASLVAAKAGAQAVGTQIPAPG